VASSRFVTAATPATLKSISHATLLLAWWVLVASPVLTAATPQALAPNPVVSVARNERTFLILSDIHFDPFTGTDQAGIEALIESPVEKWPEVFESHAGPDLPRALSDTNFALLMSALSAAHSSGMQHDYVLVTGDYLGHNFERKYWQFVPDGRGYQDFVIKTMVFVNRMIQKSFPAIPVIGALGNNDSLNGDYAFPGKPLLVALSKEWKVLASRPEAARTFVLGGYYAVPHPTVPSQEFIVLNTSLWSRLYTGNASADIADEGAAQLKWLTAELDRLRARKHTAALILHLPPGVDAYTSSKAANCQMPALYWKQPYLDAFLAAIGSHKNVLRDSYAGHTHVNDFRVFSDASGIPYFQTNIAPSLNPDRHDPEFEVGVYDHGSGALMNYAVFYLKASPEAASAAPSVWERAYDFRQISRFPAYNPAALQTISTLLRSNEAVRSKLLELFSAHAAVVPFSAKDWRIYSCAETEITPDSFAACNCPPIP
jgi:sphingomyelin phosphodiesterase acid-like 3